METQSIQKSRTSGFTLIELIIVVAITGIMAAMITPNVLRWVVHSRFRTAVSDLGVNLKLAKSTAIKTNANCVVTFNSPGSNWYRISCLGRSISLDEYNAGAHFQAAPPANVTFNSRGLPASNMGSEILLSNTDDVMGYKVQVSPTGAIYTDQL